MCTRLSESAPGFRDSDLLVAPRRLREILQRHCADDPPGEQYSGHQGGTRGAKPGLRLRATAPGPRACSPVRSPGAHPRGAKAIGHWPKPLRKVQDLCDAAEENSVSRYRAPRLRV